MIYCRRCAKERAWPVVGFWFHGVCGICGASNRVMEVPARDLSTPSVVMTLEDLQSPVARERAITWMEAERARLDRAIEREATP